MLSYASVIANVNAILRGASDSAGPGLVPTPATLDRPEGTRRYLVAAPPGETPGGRALVVLLHGAGASAHQVLGLAFPPSPLPLWLEIAAREQQVVIAPDAVQNADLEVAEAAWDFFREKRAKRRPTPSCEIYG
jgi:polyhydroxybutyrate depolymerase